MGQQARRVADGATADLLRSNGIDRNPPQRAADRTPVAGCIARERPRGGVVDACPPSRRGEGYDSEDATMRPGRVSIAGVSILFAFGLELWAVYFFWLAGS